MNNIKIYKKGNQVMFSYGTKVDVPFIFDNLKDFAKDLLSLSDILGYSPTIAFDSGLDLYKSTMETVIKSIQEDSDLVKIYSDWKKEQESFSAPATLALPKE